MHIWLVLLVIIILGEALLTGVLPVTRSEMYAELAKASPLIYLTAGYAFANILLLEVAQSVKTYVVLRAALKSREQRTHPKIQPETLAELHKREITAYPQRIQEDIKLSYVNRFTATTEYAISGLILVYLIYINWEYTTLIGAALVYAAVSIGVAYLFNPRLMGAEINVQATETDFRTRLCMLSFNDAQTASIKAGKIRLGYALFTKVQVAILGILPFVVLTPALVAGTINFQEIMAQASIFGLIVVNAAILVSIFPVLIQGRASEHRAKELD